MSGTLVVGGSGFVGGEVVAALERGGERVVATHHRQAVSHAPIAFDFWTDDLAPLLDDHDIGTVVFAATVEHGYDESIEAFERAAARILDDCRDQRFIYVSSDSVFEGVDGRYAENDDRRPTTEYGRRLVAFEDVVRRTHGDYCIVRPGYVFGFSRGELDPRLADTRERLQANVPIEYFDDMYKSPVAVSELAAAIRTLAADDYVGVVHAGGPRTSVYRFHCDGMQGLGISPDSIVSTVIPSDMDVPPDLSLVAERLTDLTGIELSPVRDAIRSDE
ncbi:sugar nucleotide-binding protein [Halococcus sp. PRR34]|uniref:sugar nucleotide-binding protein n=1 Tax=Halococcus sp. PRR34 TaxID=3020830 RepID=UPI0023615B2B|nr:sugar nucleotide-binding protein [Halococcus sp. PRR34]